MGAPAKPRKKSPPLAARNPNLAREGGWAKVIAKYGEEGWREMCREGGRKSKRTAVPDGKRRPQIEASRAKGAKKAKRIVALMVQKYGIEDQHAEEALTYAVQVVKTQGESTKDKLSAARLILDFCKTKPASKSEVTIKSAEDLLNELEQSEKDGTEPEGA